MEDRIIIIATLTLLDNKLSELQETVKELQEYCSETEKGMLQYDWYISENSNTIKVLETYANSEAVLFHFDNHKPFSARLGQARAFVSMEIFGNANDALKQRVKKINAQHFTAIASLNKLK
jgi:quinol monooxygenase YgiN